MEIVIDHQSGFCFGVKRAIDAAEKNLRQGKEVYSLGDIVHNEKEVERLEKMGLKVIDHQQLSQLENETVLFRAHGEPPSSYQQSKQQSADLIDATCPVVLKLQQRIKKAWEQQKTQNGQIVIFGTKGHAEIKGLQGQANSECIIVEGMDDMTLIDFSRPVEIFAQTTKDPDLFNSIINHIKENSSNPSLVVSHNTTCSQVSGRAGRLQVFAPQHDVIVFVGGTKSSNSKILFNTCKRINPQSYFVVSPDGVEARWFSADIKSVGIFGATSTPLWLMEEVAEQIRKITKQ